MKNKALLPILTMLVLGIGILLGGLINKKASANTGNPNQYSKMQEILTRIDEEYVDDVQKEKLFEESISNMLHKLDPHSNYIPASELAGLKEQMTGQFGGVGIRFAIIRDTISVTNVVEGSPAEKAGLKAGDKILKINGKKPGKKKGIKSDDVMTTLRGKVNTKVDVTVLRGKKQIETSIVRGMIPIPSILCAQMLDNATGYIRLESFSQSSYFEFKAAANFLVSRGMTKLIFDLRDNPGGILQVANQICDEFLPAGKTIVEVKAKKDGVSRVEKSTNGGILENIQTVILINEGSASASEIVAGALQDNDRALIVGRRSFGKGLVQQDFLLRDNSNLRLTIARYYTPSGRSIQKPYNKDFEKYYNDDRAKNGEYFAPDTISNKKAPKFKTLKGRTVYGGGGITPDYFVALDTSNSTFFYMDLRLSQAFQHQAFDFAQTKRNTWKDVKQFYDFYQVSDLELAKLVEYGVKSLDVKMNQAEFSRSKELIRRALKAEIARQLFIENGYFFVIAMQDKEVLKARSLFK